MKPTDGARLVADMPAFSSGSRLVAAAPACLAAGGCSLWHRDAKPAAAAGQVKVGCGEASPGRRRIHRPAGIR
jgi:hypothetical protein